MENKNESVQGKLSVPPTAAEAMRNVRLYAPVVDIYETKDNFVITVDLPGVDNKSLDITVEKNILTIRGSVESRQYPDHEALVSEYDVGDYRRSFILSGDVDRDKIEATLKDGVLRLTLPKSEEMKVKKIAVH